MKKYISFMILALFFMSGTCLPTPNKNSASLENITVIDYINVNSDSGNIIIGSKMCTELDNYKYMYQLDNSLWIPSNEQWKIGSVVKIINISNERIISRSKSSKEEKRE